MGRLMIAIPAAIVCGAIIGVAQAQYNLNEDQSLAAAVITGFIILYTTRNIE